MKKRILKCPYCQEKLGFIRAFQNKANKEYFCPECSCISDLELEEGIRNLAKILFVLIALVAVVFSLFIKFYIWGTILIVLLFMAFYWQVPRFIRLKKKLEE